MKDFLSSPGARTFLIVWFGQLVSGVGSAMTTFGLSIWVFLETGSATKLALIILAAQAPKLLVSPFAGALIDRWDRRWAMILSDTGAAVGTLATLLLVATGRLEIWHLYVTLSFSGFFSAFQFPAYSAATTLLIGREHYARAAGLVELAHSANHIVAPTIAAAAVVWSGLGIIFAIDLVTFLVAVATLLGVRFPAPPPVERGGSGVGGLLREAKQGLDFVLEKRALLILMLSFVVVNFAFGFTSVLQIPLLLNITTEQTAGLIVSLGGGAIAAGSIVLTVWGGPRDRIRGVYLPIFAMGVGLVLMGLRPAVVLVAAGILLLNGTHPIAAGSSQSIWQSKVPPELQGRVFAIRQVSSIIAAPAAYLLAGTLADGFFEPFMEDAPALLANILGSGPGRGIGLIFVLVGLFAMVVALVAWNLPRIRNLEKEVPDLETIATG